MLKYRDFEEKSVAMVGRVRGVVDMGMSVVNSGRWCGDGYGGGEEWEVVWRWVWRW